MLRSLLRGPAAFMFPAFLAVGLLTLWARGGPWRGEWQWTFDAANGGTVLTGPLVAATSAAAMIRYRGYSLILDATARAGRGRLLAVGAVVAVGLTAWLLVAVVALTATAATIHGGPTPVWVLAAGPLVLAANAGVGAVIGYHWPARATPLLVAPALFLFGALGEAGTLPNVLRHGPGTASLAGITWNAGEVMWEFVALAMVAIACAAAVASRPFNPRRRIAHAVILGAAFTTLLGLHTFVGGPRFTITDEAPTTCAGRSPMVCVAPSNHRALGSVSAAIKQMSQRLRTEGLPLADSYRQVLPGTRGAQPWGAIELHSNANDLRQPPEVAALALATPAVCAAYSDPATPPPFAVGRARQAIAEWLMSDEPRTSSAFKDWLGTTYLRLRACELALVTEPPRP